MYVTRFADGRYCYSPQGWRRPLPVTLRDWLRAIRRAVVLLLLMVAAVSAYWSVAL